MIVAWVVLTQILSFFLNPFVYLFLFLVYMQYRRQVGFERKLFHVRINTAWEQLSQSVMYGLFGGMIASCAVIMLGVVISPVDMLAVFAISLILACLHIQYLCFAYAGGIAGVLSYAVGFWPQGADLPGIGWLWAVLLNMNMTSLLAIVGILHLVEAILVKLNAGRGSSPLFINGKRGLLVGAYQLQKFWFIPLFTIISVPQAEALPISLASWWPLLAAGAGTGFSLLLLPVVIGFADTASSSLPAQQARKSFRLIASYSLILLALSIASLQWHGMVLVASLFAVLGHEGIIRLSRWRDRNKTRIFVQRGQGAVVLAVVPQSPAEVLGVEPGDILVKINGKEITHCHDVYPALQIQSTFCKMEVQNIDGHIKYVQRTVYQGDHHQLGLIFAPDEQADYYVDMKPVNIFKLISQRIKRGA
jgi:hypothetical protein